MRRLSLRVGLLEGLESFLSKGTLSKSGTFWAGVLKKRKKLAVRVRNGHVAPYRWQSRFLISKDTQKLKGTCHETNDRQNWKNRLGGCRQEKREKSRYESHWHEYHPHGDVGNCQKSRCGYFQNDDHRNRQQVEYGDYSYGDVGDH